MRDILNARLPLMHSGMSIALRDTYGADDDIVVPLEYGGVSCKANALGNLPAHARIPLLYGGLTLSPADIAASGSSAPDWVPANAVIHIDFTGGTPQGRAWVRGTGEVALDILLGSDPNTEEGWNVSAYNPAFLTPDGYGSDANVNIVTAFIGPARDLLLGDVTCTMQCKDGSLPGIGSVNEFAIMSADGNDALEIDITTSAGFPSAYLNCYSWSGSLEIIIDDLPATNGAINVAAFTLAGSRFEAAATGSAVSTEVITDLDRPAANPLVAALITAGHKTYVQNFTIYDPLPTTAGLSELSVVSTPPGSYHAPAVHFDGAASLGNDSLTSIDNSYFSFVAWFKVTVDQIGWPIYGSDPDNQGMNATDITGEFGGPAFVRCNFGAGSGHFALYSTATFDDPATWHSVILSVDLTNAAGARKAKLYFDDAESTLIHTDIGSAGMNLQINGLKFLFGDDGYSDLITGDFADTRIMPGVSLLDGSGDIPEATRRLFVDADGKPVDPAIATAALGAPCILFSGNAATFGTNQGTGGAFSLTGALTNATTSPSD